MKCKEINVTAVSVVFNTSHNVIFIVIFQHELKRKQLLKLELCPT